MIIPVRNGENYIREAVLSVLNQGQSLREVLVIDDGSTDQTLIVLDTIHDERLTILSRGQGPGGVSAVRNQGLHAASGEWLMFLDADDRLKSGAFDALLARRKEGDVAIYGDYQRIDERGRSIGQRQRLGKRQKPSGDILEPLLGGNFIVNGGIMLLRRDVFLGLGGFDQTLAYAEDWFAWCRLATKGTITYVPSLHVMDYRVHLQSVMMQKPLTLDHCLPAVEATFADAEIVARFTEQRRTELKDKAIAHMQAYCIAQGFRAKRYRMAIKELTSVLFNKPKHFPRMAAISAAALLGL